MIKCAFMQAVVQKIDLWNLVSLLRIQRGYLIGMRRDNFIFKLLNIVVKHAGYKESWYLEKTLIRSKTVIPRVLKVRSRKDLNPIKK